MYHEHRVAALDAPAAGSGGLPLAPTGSRWLPETSDGATHTLDLSHLYVDARGLSWQQNLFATTKRVVWSPESPSDMLTIMIQEDKTGSSSVRKTLTKAELSTKAGLSAFCFIEPGSTCNRSAVMPADYGACDAVKPRPCQYFTTIREPLARLISEYSYFCLACQDKKKFCEPVGRLNPARCPHQMSIVEWARNFSNPYTHHFSRSWTGNRTRHGYYHAKSTGFGDLPVAERKASAKNYESALMNLSKPDMLVLKTEELSSMGWNRLGNFLGQSNLADFASKSNVHEHDYEPTQAERDVMREANGWDIKLYQHLAEYTCWGAYSLSDSKAAVPVFASYIIYSFARQHRTIFLFGSLRFRLCGFDFSYLVGSRVLYGTYILSHA